MNFEGTLEAGANLRDTWDEIVRAHADREFLIFEDVCENCVTTHTYAQADRQIARYANAFDAAGIRPGDRVVVYLPNSVEFVECLLALAFIGAVVVPLDTKATAFECVSHIQVSQARAVVLSHDSARLDGPTIAESGAHLFTVGQSLEGYDSLTDLAQAQAETLNVHPDLDEQSVCEIMYTSGTTAQPKGAMITHGNFVFSGRYVNWELAMTGEDRYLTSMVASHVNFQLSALAPVITAGATLVLLSKYSASRFWAQVRGHRATLVQGMAMIVMTLLAQKVDPQERDHCVREIHYFLNISTRQKEAFEERFGVRLLNNYGSTETLVGVLTDPPRGERRWPSIGRVGPGYDVRLVDEEGNPVPEGREGEIQIHGIPGITLMKGYWENPQATAEAISEGWYRTGDYGYIDDGWVYFLDRRTDLIKRNGESISSAEVENTLRTYPGVVDAAVIGVPDSIHGHLLRAFVIPEKDTTLDTRDITEFCRRKLAQVKVPSQIRLMDELPRGSYGKVKKEILKTL